MNPTTETPMRRAYERAYQRAAKALEPTRAGGVYPGLPPGPIEPELVQLAMFLFEPIEFVQRMRARFGPVFTIRVPGVPPIVQCSSREAVRDVFSGSPEELYAGEANLVLEPLLGPSSLLLLDGDRHRSQRKLLTPPLRGDRMRGYGTVMRDVTEAALVGLREGETVSIHDLMQRMTLEVIVRTVFGVDERDGAALGELRAGLASTIAYGTRPELMVRQLQVDLGPRSPWGGFLAHMRDVRGLIGALLATRRREGTAGRSDMLSMLAEARHEDGSPMQDDEIVDELLTLLVAGHETTATALSWTIHRLIRHPEVQARAADEVLRLFPDRVDPERIGEATYLHAVNQESLRIHPVVPGVGRRLKVDATIGGHKLPKGVIVGLSVVNVHFDPAVHPDPHAFRPERFLERKILPTEYFPFGGGVRRCIGMGFALFEMDVMLAVMLRQLHFVRHAGDAPVRVVRRSVTLAPSDGLPVRIARRRVASA